MGRTNGTTASGGIAFAGLLLLSVFGAAGGAVAGDAAGFDATVATTTTKLPEDLTMTCVSYPDLTVRIQPLPESDPEILVIKGAKAPCKPGKVAGAIRLSSTHDLLGRKGALLVFGGPLGVDVFDLRSAKRIHQGTVFQATAARTAPDPKALAVTAEGDGLHLVYRQEVYDTCSMMTDRGCWGKLTAKKLVPAELAKTPPNCAAAYKQPDASPENTTAVGFSRDVRITAAGQVTTTVSGPVLCRSL